MAPLCNCKERDRFRDRKWQINPTMSGLGISAHLGWASSTPEVTTYFVISCWAPTAHTWPKLCKSRFAFSQEVCKSLSFGCNHCASRQILHCFPRATWSCKRKRDCFLLTWLSEGSALTADDRGIPEITWDCGYGSTRALFMTLVASRGGGTQICGYHLAQPKPLSTRLRQTTAEGPTLGDCGRDKGQPDPLPVLTKRDRVQFGTFEKGGCVLLSAVKI